MTDGRTDRSAVLDGVLTALLTPTTTSGEPDAGALEELVDFQVAAGVDGLFVLGTAGQGPMLEPTERRDLAGRIVEITGGRLKVVVHVGALPMAVATDLAAHAASIGADAIASVPPVYYSPDFRAVREYYAQLRHTAGDDVPLLAYNNPPATGYDLRPDQAASLHDEGVIDGVKQASSSIADLSVLLDRGVPVWMASAACNLAAMAMGARGAISTITNVVPELFVALHAAMGSGDLGTARDNQRRITTAASRLREPIIGALHAACELRGLRAGRPRPPLRWPTDAELDVIRGALTVLDDTGPT